MWAWFVMDVRGIERLLEKTYGMADTASAAGAKTLEGIVRDARFSDETKRKLIPLYRRESLRRMLNYAELGLAVCEVIASDLEDEGARARWEFYRDGFAVIHAQAQSDLQELDAA